MRTRKSNVSQSVQTTIRPRIENTSPIISFDTLLIVGVVSLGTLTLFFLYQAYQKCLTLEEKGIESQATGAIVCTLFSGMAQKLGYRDLPNHYSQDQNECINTFLGADNNKMLGENCIGHDDVTRVHYEGDMTTVKEVPDLIAAMKLRQPIYRISPPYNNTFAHTLVMNHAYGRLEKIFQYLGSLDRPRIEADMIRLSCTPDINGNTILHLSLATAADGKNTRLVMTKENVILKNKKNETALMFAAAGFSNPQTTQHLICMIGNDRLAAEFAAKDENGRSVEDYSQMSRDEVAKRLSSLVVHPYKASNHCFNALGEHTIGGSIFTGSEQVLELMSKIFDTAQTDMAGEKYHVILATKANTEKMITFAESPSAEDKKLRAAINVEIYPGFSPKELRDMWNAHKKNAENLLPIISPESIVDYVLSNQASNIALIRESVNIRTEQEKNDHKGKIKR